MASGNFSWTLVLLLLSPGARAEDAGAISTMDTVFYTVGITGIAFFMVTLISLRQKRYLTYALYGALILALLASLDQTLARVLGQGAAFSAVAPLLIGALLAATGFWQAAYRIETPHPLRRVKVPFYLFSMLALSLIPGPLVIDSLVPLYAVLNTLVLLSAVAQIMPPLTWTSVSPWQHRLALYFPILFAMVFVSFYVTHFVGAGFEPDTLNAANRVFFMLHLSHILSMVVAHIVDTNREHLAMTQRAAEAAQAAAEQALALSESKQAYQEVQRVARARSLKLAEASHDMKQPIAALRSAIQTIHTRDRSMETRRIEQAMEYLDLLASEYLESSTAELAEESGGGRDHEDDHDLHLHGESARSPDGRETVGLGLLLASLEQMFTGEVAEAGVELRVRHCDHVVTTRPLSVLRILSNLVSNALEHARPHRILVGTRRRPRGIGIVVADDGVGMADGELEELRQTFSKGTDSEGNGLGLAIVSALAEEAGLAFTLRSRPGRGTYAMIEVPL